MSFEYINDQSQETMQGLITTEGMLFQDEFVKKFYIIIKYYVIEIFENIWNIYSDDVNEYCNVLKSFESFIDLDDLLKKYPTIEKDLQDCVILYTKYIFKKDIIKLKKPNILVFLKGFFQKFIQIKSVRNGSFYNSGMLDQDFLFRDIFRQTLFIDCMIISERMSASGISGAPSVLPTFSVLTTPYMYPSSKLRASTTILDNKVSIESTFLPNVCQGDDSPKLIPDIPIQTNQDVQKDVQIPLPNPVQEVVNDLSEKVLEQQLEEKKPDVLEPELVLPPEPLSPLSPPDEKTDAIAEVVAEKTILQLPEVMPSMQIQIKEKDDFVMSDEEDITEDDSISRVMEKMFIESIEKSNSQKKIKKIIF